MKEILVQQVPILASLPSEELDRLSSTLAVRKFPSGTTLLREGERGEFFYIILVGSVEIIKSLGTADERPLGTSGAGDFVGEMSLLNANGLRMATVRATSEVELLEVPCGQFDALLKRYPSVGYEVVHVLSQRLDASNNAAIRDLHQKNQELSESHRALTGAYQRLKVARRLSVGLLGILLLGAVAVAGALGYFLLSARTALETPSDIVLLMAELGRNFVIPREVAARKNPQPSNPNVVANARKLFTTRCALCHGNDGKGQTAIGSHIYPRATDLTNARVQSKTDGELYWIVENGSPHTGMPGWKGTLNEDELWQAVSYIRLLPKGESAITQLLPTPTPAPTAAASKAVTLTMENDYYLPDLITVSVGTRITWFNKDEDDHTVTSETDPHVLDSPVLNQNQSFTFVFTQPGTYKYFCIPHDFMHGVVVVQ